MKRYDLIEGCYTAGENGGVIEAIDGDYYRVGDVEAELSRLNAKISELEKDARRYQRIVSNYFDGNDLGDSLKYPENPVSFAAAIDSQLNVPGNKA